MQLRGEIVLRQILQTGEFTCLNFDPDKAPYSSAVVNCIFIILLRGHTGVFQSFY